jgi:hypothetical protein
MRELPRDIANQRFIGDQEEAEANLDGQRGQEGEMRSGTGQLAEK